MHVNLLDEPVRYVAPWELERVDRRVAEARRGKDLNVVYLYERPDTSTFRYRVYNMVEALRAAPDLGVSATWFALYESDHLLQAMPNIDVLVVCRVRYSRIFAYIISRAKMLGVRILFDCDDLVFDINYVHLISVTLDQETESDEHWQSWFAMIGRIQAAAALCDGGITTNAFLAERLEKIVGGVVSIVPNFLSRQQEELSRRLLSIKRQRGFVGDDRVMIGYFSGTPTHNRDFEVALPALLQLMRDRSDVWLRIVGFMKSFASLAEFENRIEIIELQDWLNLQVKIAEVDINIAPLQQNEFTNCKSELKFFEAAAVGAWTCATRTFTLEKAIPDPAIGQLTENGDWLAALQGAVDRVKDAAGYRENAEMAAQTAYDNYGWSRHTSSIVGALHRSMRETEAKTDLRSRGPKVRASSEAGNLKSIMAEF